MAAATGKKESVPLSLFMEVNDLVVEEDFSTMVALWGRRRVNGKIEHGAAEVVEAADF